MSDQPQNLPPENNSVDESVEPRYGAKLPAGEKLEDYMRGGAPNPEITGESSANAVPSEPMAGQGGFNSPTMPGYTNAAGGPGVSNAAGDQSTAGGTNAVPPYAAPGYQNATNQSAPTAGFGGPAPAPGYGGAPAPGPMPMYPGGAVMGPNGQLMREPSLRGPVILLVISLLLMIVFPLGLGIYGAKDAVSEVGDMISTSKSVTPSEKVELAPGQYFVFPVDLTAQNGRQPSDPAALENPETLFGMCKVTDEAGATQELSLETNIESFKDTSDLNNVILHVNTPTKYTVSCNDKNGKQLPKVSVLQVPKVEKFWNAVVWLVFAGGSFFIGLILLIISIIWLVVRKRQRTRFYRYLSGIYV